MARRREEAEKEKQFDKEINERNKKDEKEVIEEKKEEKKGEHPPKITLFFSSVRTDIGKYSLIKANALGDDRNLVQHGSKDPTYQYSINDAMHLLNWIRQKQLEPFGDVRVEDKGAFFTENTSDLLLTDPYHQDHFTTSLADDISKITGTDAFLDKRKWFDMPKTIIIPILSPGHWRLVTVTIEYTERIVDIYRINISFDDPFGIGRFPKGLQESMGMAIEKQVRKLIAFQTKNMHPELMITTNEKEIDQQGKSVNSWNCGPILFSNIEDIVKYANNGEEEIAYSIPVHTTPSHQETLINIRVRDIDRYSETAGITLGEKKVSQL